MDLGKHAVHALASSAPERGRARRLLAVALMAGVMTLTLLSSAVFAADIKDVPPDHWAYKAVQSLVDKGYLTLYQDGTFQGGHAVDRYTFADVIARLLAQLQSGSVEAAPDDVKTLSRLVNEFRVELAQVVTNSKDLAASLVRLKSETAVLREDLTQVRGDTFTNRQDLTRTQQDLAVAQKELSRQIGAILNDVAALKSDSAKAEKASAARDAAQDKFLAEHTQSIAGLNQSLAGHTQSIASLNQSLAASVKAVSSLDGRVGSLDGRVGSVERALETLSGGSVKLGSQLESLQGAAGGLDGRVGALETGFNDLSPKMAESLGAIDNLQKALDALRVDLEQGRKLQDEKNTSLTTSLDAATKDIGQRLDSRVTALDESLTAKLDSANQAIGSLKESLAKQSEGLSAQSAEAAALRQKLAELEGSIAAVNADTKKFGNAASQTDEQVKTLAADLELTKKQLADLRRQVGQDLTSQQAGQLVRQRNVQDQLTSLQDEFTSYRKTSEKQIDDLKRNNTLLLLGVILAAVIGVLVR